MKTVADLHLHSKYSRAVSPQMNLPVMAKVAVEKGLNLLSASDWTHPGWFSEITDLLEEVGEGVYGLREGTMDEKKVRFILSTEISSIYKQGDKLRRIHNLVFISSLNKAEQFSNALVSKGCNISADGRPIVGLTAKQLLELLLQIDEKGFLIPCHVWTPHFGLYGSASGFDSIEEAFGELSEHIYGIETGISSDPGMNWSIDELKTRSILSFSDAHSPAKMGREATVFTLSEMKFANIKQAIHKGSSRDNRILYTIEFYPEEGKYHYSGHRGCKISLSPEQIRSIGVMCSVCHKKVTEGVFIRLSQLAGEAGLQSATISRKDGVLWLEDPDNNQPPFVKLVPLLEIIAQALGSSVGSKKVKDTYGFVLSELGSEMHILLDIPLETIARAVGERIAEGVAKVRQGDLLIEPGYDGEYGVVKLWEDGAGRVELNAPQLKLEL